MHTRTTQLITDLAQLLREEYIFPETADKICELLMQKSVDNAYTSFTNDTDLADALTRDIRSINNDKHLVVRCASTTTRQPTPKQSAARLQKIREHNFGFKKSEVLPMNIGYVEIDAFIEAKLPGAGQAAVDAMQTVSDADALIFDLRANGGGSPTMIQLVTTYLFNGDPIHLNSFYLRKTDTYQQFWTLPFVPGKRMPDIPVFVLTSATTFSGAEEFAYNLQTLKRATIVGEQSGGGAHPGDFLPLTEAFDVFIPHGRAVNPITHTNWEGVGVTPDIVCKSEDALRVALELC